MVVGRWSVQLAAIWHCYLPLCIYIFFLSAPLFFAHCLLTTLCGKGSIQSTRLMDMGTARLPCAKVKSGHSSFELSIGPPAVEEAID